MNRSQLLIIVAFAFLIIGSAFLPAFAVESATNKATDNAAAIAAADEMEREERAASVTRPARPIRPKTGIRPPRRDPNSAKELAFLKDPNGVRSRMQPFAGLDTEVDLLSRSGSSGMRGWTRPPGEDNLMLARSVHTQAMQELTLIHKLAKEEGSLKTVAAIEGLMLEREERYGKLITRMEDMRRRNRRGPRGVRGGRRGGRYNEQDQNGHRGGRGGSRYNPRGGRYDDRRGGSYRGSGTRGGYNQGGYQQDNYYEDDRNAGRR